MWTGKILKDNLLDGDPISRQKKNHRDGRRLGITVLGTAKRISIS